MLTGSVLVAGQPEQDLKILEVLHYTTVFKSVLASYSFLRLYFRAAEIPYRQQLQGARTRNTATIVPGWFELFRRYFLELGSDSWVSCEFIFSTYIR